MTNKKDNIIYHMIWKQKSNLVLVNIRELGGVPSIGGSILYLDLSCNIS